MGIVYSPLVRLLPIAILTLACTSLLSMQMSGLHSHANLHGDDIEVHGSHIHQLDPDGHDHSADVDVSLVELGIVWSNLIAMLPGYAMVLLAIVWTLNTLWSPPLKVQPLRRRSRWRPPLRAPPISA